MATWGTLSSDFVAAWSTGAARLLLGRTDELIDRLWAFEALPHGDTSAAFLYAAAGRFNEARTAANSALYSSCSPW